MQIEKEPVLDEQGRVRYFISIEHDVSERKAQELALARSEQMLRDAVEALADGFVLFDEEDRVVMFNERYREMYRTTGEAIRVGIKFEDGLRYGLDRGQYRDALSDPEGWLAARMKTHRNPTGKPVEQQLDDGRWVQIREHATGGGGIVGIRTDVTELKKAQLAAVAASKAKSEFLTHMSHELRTPMTAILGLLDLLDNTELDPTQSGYIADLRSSSRGLLHLLNDLLDLSKVEAGRLELEELDFSLLALLEEVKSLFHPQAKTKGLSLTTEFDEKLPDWIRGDPARLRQIILNLVGNAIKFTETGGVTLAARCVSNENGGSLEFAVSDSGIGMTPDQVAKVFDPFTQADSSISRRFEGTGLGLSISKRLAQAMRGNVSVKSEPGVGSTFLLCIPFNEAKRATPPPARTAAPDLQLPELQILFAEDIEINRMIVQRMLENEGHQVTGVENGREALDTVQREKFDLVLMDMRMPVMDGMAATKAIRKLHAPVCDIPIIALTADAMEEQQKEFFAAGVNSVLSKPVDWVQLRDTIMTLLADQAAQPRD